MKAAELSMIVRPCECLWSQEMTSLGFSKLWNSAWVAALQVDYKSNLKCGDLQGINDSLVTLGRVISFILKHDLFCYLNFRLHVMSAFYALYKFNSRQDFEWEKKQKQSIEITIDVNRYYMFH